VQRTFSGYHLPSGRTVVRVAETALRACGHEPLAIASGGASDANALIARGLQVVNMANGTERNHEPGERVSVAALEEMLDVALALLDAAADASSDAAR
jgi:tripeptide aminopeptidase